VWTTLGDVVDINPWTDASSLPDQTPVSFVPMPAVEAESGRIDTTDTRPLGELRGSYTAFREGDVLFAKITPSMENGKSAVARALISGIGFGSTEFHVLRPWTGVDARFVQNYVARADFRRAARRHMKGSAGQLRVPANYLEGVLFPLAPEQEQHRIVAAIEEHFSRLDAGVAALERVKVSIKRYRTAILKAAAEGRLTIAWRRENPNVEPASDLLAQILEERRERWESKQLVLCQYFTDG
jgi:type I restriction enzyme, S subunit